MDKIDFSASTVIKPRSDSWEKVLSRIESRKKNILFKKLSSVAVAASVLLVAGSFFLWLHAAKNDLSMELSAEISIETISWYAELGSGESVSSFATAIDDYYPAGD